MALHFKESQTVLDKAGADGGLVLVSFGSLVNKSMPPAMATVYRETFAAFPSLQFAMKSLNQNDSQNYANLSNVHALHWLDQRALLGRANTFKYIYFF